MGRLRPIFNIQNSETVFPDLIPDSVKWSPASDGSRSSVPHLGWFAKTHEDYALPPAMLAEY